MKRPRQNVVGGTGPDELPLLQEVRGVRVLLDRALARLSSVPVKRPNEQFRRNRDRFPEDFAF